MPQYSGVRVQPHSLRVPLLEYVVRFGELRCMRASVWHWDDLLRRRVRLGLRFGAHLLLRSMRQPAE